MFSLFFIWVRIELICGWLDKILGESSMVNLSKLFKIYELYIFKFRFCGNRRRFYFFVIRDLFNSIR